MGFDGKAVANFILDRCNLQRREITHLSLQKILYFCHVSYLKSMNTPLIKHQFEAWEHGPVLQYIYQQFKKYDDNPITGRATKIDKNTGERIEVKYKFDEQTTIFLEQIIDFYSQLSVSQLITLSHEEGGPWYKAWYHSGRINPGMKIENDQIMKFYSSNFTLQ